MNQKFIAVPYYYNQYKCWLLVNSVCALSYPARNVSDLFFYQQYPLALYRNIKSDSQILAEFDNMIPIENRIKEKL